MKTLIPIIYSTGFALRQTLLLKLSAASGVFAARCIRRGEVVETAHCIYISREEYDQHLRQGSPVLNL